MMKQNASIKIFIFPLLFLMFAMINNIVTAAEIELRGQASAWLVTNPDIATQTGLRYIPDLLAGTLIGDQLLDTELSLNMFGSAQFFHKTDSIDTYHEFNFYRLWLRFSGTQYEIRVGLQKINFGSAMLLRPLMWFDSIDPRDPLQLTEGVYGLMGRYFFINNANIWLWVLYGNDQIRGWDVFVSDRNKPEFGGRIQVPLFTGEIAATYHQRKINLSENPIGSLIAAKNSLTEQRFGLDGKWDIEVGFWLEAVLIHRDLIYKQFSYQRQTNIGVDYTFDVGNGLTATTEHFTLRITDKAFGSGEGISMTALSLNYPFGLLDDLTGMIYYDWDQKDWYRFIRWQRQYDNWSFYLMGFWNPEEYQIYQTVSDNNLFAGKGLQLLVVFNH